MTTPTKQHLTLALLCLSAWATSLPAQAQFQKPEDAVKYRKAAFTLMGSHFGRMGAMVQGRAPFDAAAAASNADIVANLSRLPFHGFVEGTASKEKGGAKAEIWSERAKFDEAAKKMQDEVAKLAAAKPATVEQLKASFGPAASTCKSCHDSFRND
ncbi:c-type cytochrome [Paucibacter sp. DJ2R-2]|uniref:c-type cytochrome n=1 Tax=unclassified Roseateles TaxID=2626991 RepID=UPI0021E36C51|nr:cytochrome c [Paucibacter sp. DJ2R-2]MCV2421053.1 cytochrome c [Paucibacter sp. DJ4R-1]MCV2439031.1 cytochrome c [Paucibacter sp. DJ2R-2]